MVPLNQKIEVDKHASVSVLLAQPETPKALLIIAHGATDNIESPAMQYLLNGFYSSNIATATFNFPFAELKRSSPDNTTRLDLAFQTVLENFRKFQILDSLPLFFAGKSMGGRTIARVSLKFPKLYGLIFIGYPFHPIGKPDDLRTDPLIPLKVPTLFFQGDQDPMSKHDVVYSVLHRIKPNPTIEWIKGGDHSLNVENTGEHKTNSGLKYVISKSVTWMDNVIASKPQKASRKRKRKV
jgi:uncharacterized protein